MGDHISKRTLPAALAGIALVALLAGCTGAPTDEAEEAGDEEATVEEVSYDFTTLIEPTWTVPAALLSSVEAAAGYLGAYVEGPERSMQAVVWDATTGQEMWRDTADPAMGPHSTPMSFSIFESGDASYAVYLRPEMGQQRTELIVADLASGTALHTIPDVFALNPVNACADSAGACVYGDVPVLPNRGQFRVDVVTGEVTRVGDPTLSESAIALGADVYAISSRYTMDGIEKIGYNVDGSPAWELPYTDVFGEGYSVNAGSTWVQPESTDVLIGTGYIPNVGAQDVAAYSNDDSTRRLVGLNPEDGAVVWSLDGVSTCGSDDLDVALGESLEILPFCRINAGVTEYGAYENFEDRTTTRVGYDMDLIGVNASTGDIEWEVPLGSAPGDTSNGAADFARSDNPIRLANVSGALVTVNSLTGDLGDPLTEGTFACNVPRELYDTYYPHTTAGERFFNAGRATYPCDVNRTALAQTAYSPDALRIAGTAIDDENFAITAVDSLSVFTVPE